MQETDTCFLNYTDGLCYILKLVLDVSEKFGFKHLLETLLAFKMVGIPLKKEKKMSQIY